MSDRSIDAWERMLETHAAVVGRLDAEMRRDHGVPLTWYEVLLILSRAPDGVLAMSDLADSLLLSRSAVTRLVDRMVSAGLVERRRCETDGRITFAAMTPEGSALFREAGRAHLRSVRRLFADHLTEAEANVMVAAFERVAARSTGSPATV